MSSNIILSGRGINRIIKSKVMLSPLAGVTDNIFRRLVRKWAPNSLLFTEMINATSLKKGFGTHKINQIDLEKVQLEYKYLIIGHMLFLKPRNKLRTLEHS